TRLRGPVDVAVVEAGPPADAVGAFVLTGSDAPADPPGSDVGLLVDHVHRLYRGVAGEHVDVVGEQVPRKVVAHVGVRADVQRLRDVPVIGDALAPLVRWGNHAGGQAVLVAVLHGQPCGDF